MTPRTTHVVGGGITGLTLALRLSREGRRVVVHERNPYLGGLSSEEHLGGVAVESYYHCVLPTDFRLLELFDEIGLDDALGWTQTRTGFFTGDALLEMTTSADFFRFPAINLFDRARLAWTILYCGAFRDGRRFDEEDVATFLRRHGGGRLFERIWEPLLLAKLGKDYQRYAASFIWATVHRMLSARKAKGRAEKLGFVKGRYGRVFGALRRAVEAAGGEVRVGHAVSGLQPDGDGWRLRFEDGSAVAAPAVVLTTPAAVSAPWLREAGVEAASAFEAVEHLGVICEVLLLRRSLTPYYVLNLTDRSLPFTGIIETSNLTGPDEYDGKHLVYLPRYRSQDDPLWGVDDEAIHRENLAGLRRVVPDLREQDVAAWRINRARLVQPVHAVGYGRRKPPVALAPGLAALCTAHLHPWPVFNDEVVGVIDRRLPEVREALDASSVEAIA